MSHQRELKSLERALDAVSVEVIETNHNGHIRVKIRCVQTKQVGNITLSASPSDFNVQRQRERQIRRELQRIGADADRFNWRKL
jgi:hypothetical protein